MRGGRGERRGKRGGERGRGEEREERKGKSESNSKRPRGIIIILVTCYNQYACLGLKTFK